MTDTTPGSSRSLRAIIADIDAADPRAPWQERKLRSELESAVRAQLAADENAWTVLGIWDNDEAVPIGAIAGRHSVHGESPGDRLHDQLIGDPDFYGFDTSSFYEQGVWAETVTAPDGDTAQDVAVEAMMRAQHGDDEDEDGDDEECQAGTCRHPHEPEQEA